MNRSPTQSPAPNKLAPPAVHVPRRRSKADSMNTHRVPAHRIPSFGGSSNGIQSTSTSSSAANLVGITSLNIGGQSSSQAVPPSEFSTPSGLGREDTDFGSLRSSSPHQSSLVAHSSQIGSEQQHLFPPVNDEQLSQTSAFGQEYHHEARNFVESGLPAFRSGGNVNSSFGRSPSFARNTLDEALNQVLFLSACETQEDKEEWVELHGTEFLNAWIVGEMPEYIRTLEEQEQRELDSGKEDHSGSVSRVLQNILGGTLEDDDNDHANGFSVGGKPIRAASRVNLVKTATLPTARRTTMDLNTSFMATSFKDGVMRRRRSMMSVSVMNRGASHSKKNLATKLENRIHEEEYDDPFNGTAAGSSETNPMVDDASSGYLDEEDSEDDHVDFATKKVFATNEQRSIDTEVAAWRIRGCIIDVLKIVFLVFNFVAIPVRIGVGSEYLPNSLLIFEHIADVCLACLLLSNYIRPREIHGQITTNKSIIAAEYRKQELLLDVIGMVPLQVLFLPLYSTGAAPIEVVDFCRINRVLLLPRFSTVYDDIGENFLQFVHPILLRIFKFVFIIIFYSLITAAPMHMVVRYDGDEGTLWMNYNQIEHATQTPGVAYVKTAWYAMSVAAGRSYPNPRTESQVLVMTFVGLFSLASMSVIIAGVTAMVLALVERTSRLSSKVDEVIHQMSHMRLPEDFIDEVCQYYRYMFNVFNTFDYTAGDDFLDDLPDDLLGALNAEVHMSTVKQIPLFSKLRHDVEFVKELAERLEMHLLMPGTIIFSKGEEGTDMFFISKGEASVLLDGATEFAILKQGSFFGEQAMLYGKPRGATVVAKTLCQVFCLSKSAFEDMIEIRPEALRGILDVTVQRKVENEREKIKQEADDMMETVQRHASLRSVESKGNNNFPGLTPFQDMRSTSTSHKDSDTGSDSANRVTTDIHMLTTHPPPPRLTSPTLRPTGSQDLSRGSLPPMAPTSTSSELGSETKRHTRVDSGEFDNPFTAPRIE